MDEWKELTTGKMIRVHKSGFVITKPIVEYNHIPIDCPVCMLVMRDHNDMISYQRNECCRDCEVRWAEPLREKWKSGWRPDDDDLKN